MALSGYLNTPFEVDIVLDENPQGAATVQLTPASPAGVTISPTVLSFNESNWNIPQQVTATLKQNPIELGGVTNAQVIHTKTTTSWGGAWNVKKDRFSLTVLELPPNVLVFNGSTIDTGQYFFCGTIQIDDSNVPAGARLYAKRVSFSGALGGMAANSIILAATIAGDGTDTKFIGGAQTTLYQKGSSDFSARSLFVVAQMPGGYERAVAKDYTAITDNLDTSASISAVYKTWWSTEGEASAVLSTLTCNRRVCLEYSNSLSLDAESISQRCEWVSVSASATLVGSASGVILSFPTTASSDAVGTAVKYRDRSWELVEKDLSISFDVKFCSNTASVTVGAPASSGTNWEVLVDNAHPDYPGGPENHSAIIGTITKPAVPVDNTAPPTTCPPECETS